MSDDWLYANWKTAFGFLIAFAAISGVASYLLHRYYQCPFNSHRNWGSLGAMMAVSVNYALLGWIDTIADIGEQAGKATRAEAAGCLVFIKVVAVFAVGFYGLVLLSYRDEIDVLHNPSVQENYHYLFGDFDGHRFVGYGAPFQLETAMYDHGGPRPGECSDLAREQLRRLTRIREAIYIFHTTEEFDRARQFFEARVFPHAEAVIRNPWRRARLAVRAKVILYQPVTNKAHDISAHSYAFFLGTRRGNPCCILYPSHEISALPTRRPGVALVLNNDHNLFHLLMNYFNERWNSIDATLGPDCEYVRHVWCPVERRFVVDNGRRV